MFPRPRPLFLRALTAVALVAGFHVATATAAPEPPRAPLPTVRPVPAIVSRPDSSETLLRGIRAALRADSDRWYTWATTHPPVRTRLSRPSRAAGGGDRRACILARENHGDYGRSTNPTHFGAYQYDRRTWEANGGDPATWGTASPAEQDQVFENTVAAHGYSAWAPYDGC